MNCRKFHKARKYIGNYNITDISRKTQTQEFIEIYTNLKAEGALDDEKIFEVALEQFDNKTVSLVDDFKRAAQTQPPPATPQAPGPNISVTDFYKE